MAASLYRALILFVLALPPVASSAAQDFPLRPVRLVVPYAAGGSGDVLARLLGNKLSAIWGQQIVVDNRPGANGLIGTEFAARSEPDGYTLYLATDGLYAEVARVPGLLEEMSREFRVLILGPSLFPALLRTVIFTGLEAKLRSPRYRPLPSPVNVPMVAFVEVT